MHSPSNRKFFASRQIIFAPGFVIFAHNDQTNRYHTNSLDVPDRLDGDPEQKDPTFLNKTLTDTEPTICFFGIFVCSRLFKKSEI